MMFEKKASIHVEGHWNAFEHPVCVAQFLWMIEDPAVWTHQYSSSWLKCFFLIPACCAGMSLLVWTDVQFVGIYGLVCCDGLWFSSVSSPPPQHGTPPYPPPQLQKYTLLLCACVCVHVCVCVCLCMLACMSACLHECMCACMSECVCVHTCMCVCVGVYACIMVVISIYVTWISCIVMNCMCIINMFIGTFNLRGRTVCCDCLNGTLMSYTDPLSFFAVHGARNLQGKKPGEKSLSI